MSGEMTLRKRERWVTALFFALSGLVSATWSSRIPDVQRNLGLSNGVWGVVLFALPAGLVVGLSGASWLVTRYGTTKIMIGGSVLVSIFLALAGAADSTAMLVPALFFLGFTRTTLNIAMNTRSIAVQRLYDRPIITSFHGIWSLSCFAAAAIGTLLIIYGLEPAYHFMMVGVVVIVIALLFIGKRNAEAGSTEKRPLFVKPDAYLLILGAIAFCGMLSESAMFDWSVNYFETVVGTKKAFITAGYTAFIIAMAAGRLGGDWLIHKYGVFVLIKVNGLLMAIGFMIAVLFPFLLPAALGFFLVGLGDSVIVPIVYMLAARSKKMLPSYAIASVTMIGYGGFLLGPLIIGLVSEAFSMKWALVFVSAVSLCIFFLSRLLKGRVGE